MKKELTKKIKTKEKTNRVCRMAELDPKYCDVIIRRFINTFGGVAINQDGVEFKVD